MEKKILKGVLFANIKYEIDGKTIQDVIDILRVKENEALQEGYVNIKLDIGTEYDYGDDQYAVAHIIGDRWETHEELKKRLDDAERSKNYKQRMYENLRKELGYTN